MDLNIISNLCRLCATQDLGSNSLENNIKNEASKRKTILSLIGKYLKIKITDNQCLPQKICSECVQRIQSFDVFNRRCHDVHAMFTSISDGCPLTEVHKNLLQDCDIINQLDLSLREKNELQEATKTSEILNDSDDNFVGSDLHNDYDSNDPDGDDMRLLARSKKPPNSTTPASDTKRKRGRPRKSMLKVPPLRIKAVKPRKSNSSTDVVNETANTEYKIHGDSNEVKIKEEDSKGDLQIPNDDDIDLDNDNFSDDLYSPSDKNDSQKVPKKNPFALFEFKCTTCQEVFKNFSILKRHCKKEHNSSAFVNCVCGKQLRARTAIIEHRRKHTGTSLYKCDTCSKTFNRRSLMCLHMISHMPKDEQPFVCCKCAKRFHTSSLLKKHEKVHLPEEERFLDVCNICQKKFTSKSAVNAHLRAVHYGEKPFVCEHCGNSFSSKAILTDHLTTHSSYAPWPCSVCGRNFKSKYRLNVHMDMHRSVKYRCPHCPMELSTRRTLRMHLLVHKEEKAYVCKVCSKAFRRSKDLKNHSNLHTGRRPYRCEFCERTFANGSNCRAHKLRMHPEELGVEKNYRNSSKQSKLNNSNMVAAPPPMLQNDINKTKTLTTLTDVIKSVPPEYLKYETKYEFPATSQELDYTLDYTRYPTPLNLNMKKPTFMHQQNMNHLTAFTSDMHADVSKVHHFLSYT